MSGNFSEDVQFKGEYELYELPWTKATGTFAVPTGTWRYQRPVLKRDKCCQCGWCYLFCPTGSVVEEEGQFIIDLSFCKGCGICASVCPVDAIIVVHEGE